MRKSFSRQEGTEALSIGKVKGRPGRSLFGEATLTHLAVGHRKGRLSATETLRHRDDLATGYYSVHTNADARAGTTSPRSVDDCTTRVSWPAREAEDDQSAPRLGAHPPAGRAILDARQDRARGHPPGGVEWMRASTRPVIEDQSPAQHLRSRQSA
jgi:hypothetical protein